MSPFCPIVRIVPRRERKGEREEGRTGGKQGEREGKRGRGKGSHHCVCVNMSMFASISEFAWSEYGCESGEGLIRSETARTTNTVCAFARAKSPPPVTPHLQELGSVVALFQIGKEKKENIQTQVLFL